MARDIYDTATLNLLDQFDLSPMDLVDASKRKKKGGGSIHGSSIKNPAVYEALRGKLGKSSAAAISNAALNKGYAKGKHGRKKKK